MRLQLIRKLWRAALRLEDPGGDEIAAKATRLGELRAADQDSRELLGRVLVELRRLNTQLELITGEHIKEQDLL